MTAPKDLCPGIGERPSRLLAGNTTGATGECPVCHRSVTIGRHTGLIGKHAARRLKEPSDLELTLLKQISYLGLPEPDREYRFHPDRDWRFDLAWPADDETGQPVRVAVEVQGAIWTGGRHARGGGQETDHAKLNAAQLDGWLVLQYSRRPIDAGRAVLEVEEALRRRGVITGRQPQTATPSSSEAPERDTTRD